MFTHRVLTGQLPDTTESAFDSLLRKAARVSVVPGELPVPRPGQIVGGKYRIEERLGRGGMGLVFRATHVVSQKAVALKWMLRSSSDEHSRRRFLREALAAGRINHPNVVDVYDIVEEGGCAYLVMELLHGETLQARLARGPVGVAEAIALLLPAMRGVSAIHRAGVIHRDLKPENIFLCASPEGSAHEAKVLDFGISFLMDGNSGDRTLTKDGMLLGTPAYMSPEQIECSREIDVRADVYAFGIILYQALTGQLPFEADSYPGLLLAIVNQEPRPVQELRPDVPYALDCIVMRALAKRRRERYADVGSLIEALASFELRETAAWLKSPIGAWRYIAAGLGCALALCALAWPVVHWSSRPSATTASTEPPHAVVTLQRQTPAPEAAEMTGEVIALPIRRRPSAQTSTASAPQKRTPARRSPAVLGSAADKLATPAPAPPPVSHARSGAIRVEDL